VSEAGQLPRRLGIVVVPVHGESFPSWVDRMAARMRTATGWVVRELGIELLAYRGGMVSPLHYGISMSRRDLEAVQAATGVPPDVVNAMLLSAYDGTVLDMSALGRGQVGHQAWARAWGLFRGSRCCPDCVAAGDGAWQLWWRLGGAAACPEHSVLLYGQCPRCRLPLRHDYRLSVRVPVPAGGLSACMNWRTGSRGSVCGFPLAELPSRPASASVLEVQDLYLRAAAGQSLSLAGKEVSPAGWFAEMSQLVAFARLVGPQELPGLDGVLPEDAIRVWHDDHAAGEASPLWRWRGCPPSPELAAVLLQVLSPVLRAASEPEFRDAASWLISAVYRLRTPKDLESLPPFTRRAFMTSKHRGRTKVFLPKFLQAEPHLAHQGLAAAHIPSYADKGDVLELVTPHLVPKRGAEPGGWSQRRIAALSLVFMVSDVQTWGEAVEELGLPPLALNECPGKRVLIPDLLAFREGLIVLGTRLIERCLVDYQARRAVLADLTEMPAADWAGRPGASRKPEIHNRGRIFAAAWIWSEFTGGRDQESPGWAVLPGASATASRSDSAYRKWLSGQGPVRRDWLRSWGARYLEERGCGSPSR
jgi:hypothetical protein